MSKDRFQYQRFELKYIINEQTALAARDFVSSYLELDEHCVGRPNFSYLVHSLYLDSPQFHLHRGTVNGDKNRFKLRIRYYDDQPESPVFFEIKNRMNNTISKERAAATREAVPPVLLGQFPDRSMMLSDDPRQWGAVQNFVKYVSQIQAEPRVHVGYLREAWLPREADNSVRVTFDRNVRSVPDPVGRLTTRIGGSAVEVFDESVVLELKFTSRFPSWFGELVQVFGLRQGGAAKYVDGVLIMEEEHLLHKTFRDPRRLIPGFVLDREKRRRGPSESGSTFSFS